MRRRQPHPSLLHLLNPRHLWHIWTWTWTRTLTWTWMQWAARGAAAPVVSGTTAVTVVGQQQHAPGSFSSTSSTPRPVAHLDMDVGRGRGCRRMCRRARGLFVTLKLGWGAELTESQVCTAFPTQDNFQSAWRQQARLSVRVQQWQSASWSGVPGAFPNRGRAWLLCPRCSC